MSASVASLLEQVSAWAARREDILAVALVGSWAMGTARAGSDVDLVLIVEDLRPYLLERDWVGEFGTVAETSVEDWGLVRSPRVFYADGREVEYGLTTRDWASTGPVDAGTRRVVKDGMAVILDRRGVLERLRKAIQDDGRQ